MYMYVMVDFISIGQVKLQGTVCLYLLSMVADLCPFVISLFRDEDEKTKAKRRRRKDVKLRLFDFATYNGKAQICVLTTSPRNNEKTKRRKS